MPIDPSQRMTKCSSGGSAPRTYGAARLATLACEFASREGEFTSTLQPYILTAPLASRRLFQGMLQ
eukprot:1186774-Prorocentrum_minimum.AAC.4